MAPYRILDDTVRAFVNEADGNTYWYKIGGTEAFKYAILVRGERDTSPQKDKLLLPAYVSYTEEDKTTTLPVCCIADGSVEDWGTTVISGSGYDGVFSRNSSQEEIAVTNIEIPETIDYIGIDAFFNLSTATSIKIAEYREVQGRAEDYKEITTEDFPKGQILADACFRRCYNVSTSCNIFLPSTVVSFGREVFEPNNAYTVATLQVHFATSTKSKILNYGTFSSDGNGIRGIDEAGTQQRYTLTNDTTVAALVLPEGLETVQGAFKGLSTNNYLIFPTTLKEIKQLCYGGRNFNSLYYGCLGFILQNLKGNVPDIDEVTVNATTCHFFVYDEMKDEYLQKEIYQKLNEAGRLQFLPYPKSGEKRYYCVPPLFIFE